MRKPHLFALIACLMAVFFCACKKGPALESQNPLKVDSIGVTIPVPKPNSNVGVLPIVAEANKIWTDKKYSAFTDLIYYNGLWYCVFREAESHVGTNGSIRVIESSDSKNWRGNASFKIEGRDLRDPKFIVGPSGALMVYSSSLKDQRVTTFYWTLKDNKWSETLQLRIDEGWPWEIKLLNSEMYSLSYNVFNKVKGFGGITFDKLHTASSSSNVSGSDVGLDGCATEASFVTMPDGKMISVARRDCGDRKSYVGEASAPYNKFNWTRLIWQIESPKVLLHNNVIYIAGRVHNPGFMTCIFTWDTNKKELEHYVNLPSGVDTGYPGLVVKDNHLYVSYYSTDSTGYRSIYLAKVRLKT